jgi:hypothetical protein
MAQLKAPGVRGHPATIGGSPPDPTTFSRMMSKVNAGLDGKPVPNRSALRRAKSSTILRLAVTAH